MIFERICNLIADQFGVDSESITMSTAFIEDLDADSLGIAELSMAVEEEFGLGELEEQDLSELKTVGDLVRFVQDLLDEE